MSQRALQTMLIAIYAAWACGVRCQLGPWWLALAWALIAGVSVRKAATGGGE
jgi:hypothetical protein